MLKLYGFYALPWNATAGSFIVAQSGQPWEEWSFEPFRPAVGTSTSDTSRFAEKAGTRQSPSHWQMDLQYTQTVRLATRYDVQVSADLFNIFNSQTGYDFQPARSSSAFGNPRKHFDPRRFQLAVRVIF
jgi:hypothetical protein